MAYFAKLNGAGGFYLVRGKEPEPEDYQAWRGDEQASAETGRPVLQGCWTAALSGKVLDMVVKSGKFRYQLIRRWFAEEKRFCIWMTQSSATRHGQQAGDEPVPLSLAGGAAV